MFELNWMGLLEVALKQGITLQDVLPLFSTEKTQMHVSTQTPKHRKFIKEYS